MTALTADRLDRMHCGTPGCTNCGPFYFHGRCHQAAPVRAAYVAQPGRDADRLVPQITVIISCQACGRLVAEIKPAQTESAGRITAECHPLAPLQIAYADRSLGVHCDRCNGHVATIEVAVT